MQSRKATQARRWGLCVEKDKKEVDLWCNTYYVRVVSSKRVAYTLFKNLDKHCVLKDTDKV
jgi:hypothetical protein